jgi:hypothetical protein
MQKQKISLLLLGLISVTLLSVQLPQNCAADISPQSTSVKIAFVYRNNQTDAAAFQTLLNSNGFSTDLVRCSSIKGSTFASYSLVIIGPDTATSAGMINATIVSAINGSRAKIIGIGTGGSYYLGACTSVIGKPNTMDQSNVRTTNLTRYFASSFNTPHAIPAGNTTLFTSPVKVILCYNATAYPSCVYVLGDRVKAGYHDIIQYTSRYIAWGFNASVSVFTDAASKVFIDIVNGHISKKIAFVYKSDTGGATSFQSLLNSYNVTVDLIACSSITSATFASYSLVIVGPDTVITGGSVNATIVSAINGSSANLIGIGTGGSYYLGACTSVIGKPNTMDQSNVRTTTFTPYFASNFNTPYAIPAGNTTLFTSPVTVTLCYNASAYPSSVHVLGDRVKAGYHDIVQYASRYITWGFNASASLFTSAGAKAFIDIVKYYIPDIAPSVPLNLLAIAGNNQVLLGWQAPLDCGGAMITGYNVYRGTAAGSESLIATTGNVNAYLDTTAANGVTYYYRISAVNSIGEGASSSEASATPSPDSTIPGYPAVVLLLMSVLAVILIPIFRRKKMSH